MADERERRASQRRVMQVKSGQRDFWSATDADELAALAPRVEPSGQPEISDPFHRPARLGDPETSWLAGRVDTRHKAEIRSRLKATILRIHQAHPGGLIDDELAALLPDDEKGVIARRRLDLCEAGELVATDQMRLTRRGSPATVYRIVR